MNIARLRYIQVPNNDEFIFRFNFQGIDEIVGYSYSDITQKASFLRGTAKDDTVSLIKSLENDNKSEWIQTLLDLALVDPRYKQFEQRLKAIRLCSIFI